MSGLFGGGSKPEPPKVVRMPVTGDATVQAARDRARLAALQRGGRLSTILSDTLSSVTGSTGRLGA